MSSEHKVAVITGSARGIGRACAEILLKQGYKVCISDIQRELGEKTTSDLQATYGQSMVIYQQCDVTSTSDLDGLFKKVIAAFGRLDLVMNNAGIVGENLPEKSIDINLRAVIQGSEMAIKYMGTQNGGKGGHIVNTASIAGLIPGDQLPVYIATKHAVVGYSRSLGAISKETYGIHVNCICPTFIDTELIKMVPEQVYGPEPRMKRLQDLVVTCGTTIMTVDDVSRCFLSLVTSDVSGQVMLVSPRGCGLVTKLPDDIDDVIKLVGKKI